MGAPFTISTEQACRLREAHGTPLYIYDQTTLEALAREVLSFPNAFGLTARFAMKALPSAAVLRLFDRLGLHMDASSGYEAARAIRAGIAPGHIQITSQQMPWNLKELVEQGCLFNACSLRQLEVYGQMFPGAEACVRINPGLGSGHSNRTNVGGVCSSFGIWHEHIDRVQDIAARYRLRISGMHTHIGSGADPEVWLHCAKMSLAIAARFTDATRLSLGGGFKPARMEYENGAELDAIGCRLVPEFEAFAREQGRKLMLEIEPGAFLTANAGALLCSVIDVVDTGKEGYTFIKTDAGMNDILRPALYGAQHPITLLQTVQRMGEKAEYLVVGHCCESGDILSPEPGNPEGLKTRPLDRAEVGDIVVIGGAGAYCAAMSAKNYNSFPEAPEVLLGLEGSPTLIRRRQTLEQMLENEILP